MPSYPTHPFDRITGIFLLGSILVTQTMMLFPILWIWPGWLDVPLGELALADGVYGLVWYATLFCVVAGRAWLAGLEQGKLWGNTLPAKTIWMLVLQAPALVIVAITAVFFVFVPLSYLDPEFVQRWLFEDQPVLFVNEGPGWFFADVLLCLGITVVGPIVEEYVFRGLLLTRWERKFGLSTAVFASAVAFGLLHTDWLGAALFGYIAAVVYVCTRSLLGPIVLHIANNSLAYVLEVGFSLYAPEGLNTVDELQDYWWIGALTLAPAALWLRWFVQHYDAARSGKTPYLLAESDNAYLSHEARL